MAESITTTPFVKLATPKQVDYLLDLSAKTGVELSRTDLEQLSRKEASETIEDLHLILSSQKQREQDEARTARKAAGQSGLDLAPLLGGRYAVRTEDGVKFLRVRKGTKKWAGWTFVDIQASDDFHKLGSQRPGETYRGKMVPALETILADEPAAFALYGTEIGACGICGRTLTDSESIAYGIGPVCRDKFPGFVSETPLLADGAEGCARLESISYNESQPSNESTPKESNMTEQNATTKAANPKTLAAAPKETSMPATKKTTTTKAAAPKTATKRRAKKSAAPKPTRVAEGSYIYDRFAFAKNDVGLWPVTDTELEVIVKADAQTADAAFAFILSELGLDTKPAPKKTVGKPAPKAATKPAKKSGKLADVALPAEEAAPKVAKKTKTAKVAKPTAEAAPKVRRPGKVTPEILADIRGEYDALTSPKMEFYRRKAAEHGLGLETVAKISRRDIYPEN